ncbi:hypothetical protein M0R72_18945 [Candidatus Pacearchaeota archaeon]|jgi:hypothetical protein|nr:hypothetical protein [Candidatus Pacearchaeota archaeon]
MKIEDIRLGMPMVSASGIPGTVVAISKEGGLWLETADRTRFPVHVECVRQIETAFRLGDQVRASGLSYTFRECVDGKIGKIDYLVTYGGTKCANVIWADGGENVVPVAQLAKCGECLFDEVLAREYWKPIAEVAKCYKQVGPEQLLLSAEARRVIEYLKARDCPICINNLLGCMENIMSGMAIMDGLIEARDAGIVRLDDGKYSIVRD